ncbi:aspartic peptidase domain-containing protein [Schizophyllum amplum]|uniref:Aspartic peptidase domain-containing protein n=1 Tax=Schizophyllum amplum TaxID=97359 RepID=A0A550CS29_9AGAR|nr:aspartic peptidase domain-containing protein [Auriculariopsis ampla]
MVTRFLLLAVAAHALLVSAVKVPLKQTKRTDRLDKRNGNSHFKVLAAAGDGDDSGLLDLDTVHDLIYMSDIVVGGNDYVVQLDTGSSDLWIKGDIYPLPNSDTSALSVNVTYGIGWCNGSIGFADIEFANISVSQQAFLDVSTAQSPALSYDADGILGLGFTSLSTIDYALNSTGSDKGRSMLYNLFEDNPTEPNFISFLMQRSTDDSDDIEGTFTIGEYIDEYKAVKDQKAIPTFPETAPTRWTVLVDYIFVGDNIISPTTSVPNVQVNQAVALLDSGTSYTYVPSDICNAIYGDIDGASFDSSLGQWVVPCDAEIDMAIQIGGQVFPMHPLDITPTGLTDQSQCVGSFVPGSLAVAEGNFDWLIGDNFLRSVYSVYDFGDFDSDGKMGDPYVKILSIVDPNEASQEFASQRNTSPRSGISYQAQDVDEASMASTSVTVSSDVANTLDKLATYLPAILAIMALNALVLLVLGASGMIYVCRRSRRRKVMCRTGRGFSPMPMNPRHSYIAGVPANEQPHTYEPVSMAITDDTFVAPSPRYMEFENGRPKSVRSASMSIDKGRIGDIAEEPESPTESTPVFSQQQQQQQQPAAPTRAPPPPPIQPPSPGFIQHHEPQEEDISGEHDVPQSVRSSMHAPASPISMRPPSGLQAPMTPRTPSFLQRQSSQEGQEEGDLLPPPRRRFQPGGGSLQPGDRPRSVAVPHLRAQAGTSQDRPMSYAT